MIIVVGHGIGDSSSNPGQSCFTLCLCYWERHEFISFPFSYEQIGLTGFFSLGKATSLREEKL